MTRTIQGRIKSADSDSAPLGGYGVEVFFNQEIPGVATTRRTTRALVETSVTSNSPTLRQRVSTRTDPTGHFELGIPDLAASAEEAGPLRIVVSGPAGQIVKELSHDVAPRNDADTRDSLLISVSTKDVVPTPLDEPVTPAKAPTQRITGKVFDREGGKVPANSQVLLFGRKNGDTAASAGARPILVARTDVSGYFFGEAPNENYERVSAVVSGISREIPIALNEGLIPQKLLIPVDLPDVEEPADKNDCSPDEVMTPRTPDHEDMENAPDTYSTDLGVGRCVQFNRPNRTIEEFDFYTVVRTSQPHIFGFTAGDPALDSPSTDNPMAAIAAATAAAAAAETAKALAAAAATDAQQKEAAAVKAEALAATLTTALKNANLRSTVMAMFLGRRDPSWGAAESTRQITNALTAAGVDATTAAAKASLLTNAIASEALSIVWSNDSDLVNRTVDTILGSAATALVVAATNAREAADAAADKAAATAKTAAESVQAAAAAEAAKQAAIETQTLAQQAAARAQIEAQKDRNRPPGRSVLDRDNPVDWDDTPTFYQAAEIAHGHLLHFKQIWYADGYSLGDLLYSLPLAPGQKKLVSVVDWERRERAEREENTNSTEAVNAMLARDRDLGEVVSGALTESSRGGSKSASAGIGAGTGAAGNGSYEAFNFGALVGVSGGYGQSDSNAWQASARNLSANSLQSLRDRTLQSASAVRGLRSSVVHTVAQGEAVQATTEVVANHNHGHAMTIQYFEVLRHLKLAHKLTDVQECLFVPLPMSRFDLAKTLRWRQSLQTYLQRSELLPGFEAARRVQTSWLQSDAPLARYADESVRSITGELLLTVMIPMPPLPDRPKPKPTDPADTATTVSNTINPTDGAWGVILGIASGGATLIAGKATEAAINLSKAAAQGVKGLVDDFTAQATPQERYEKFQAEIMPGLVEAFVDQLELWALVGANAPVMIKGADFTLVSAYQPGIPLMVSLRGTLTGQISRGDVSQLIIKSSVGMPTGCRAIVNSATIRYRTSSFEHSLVDDNRVNDDIDPPKVTGTFSAAGDFSLTPITIGTGATLFTPIDAWEQRSPRTEDKRLAAELIEHLNDNLEFYHHAIWWTMDPNRRYMLLDGFYAPGSNDRSVASVVENRLIGIIGNSIVMPVARGVHLDPRPVKDKQGNLVNLLDFYRLESPVPVARVSLPTRGVFAEAVLGNCNSCEEIDDSRFWRWEESPIDEPPSIGTVSTDTRRADPVSTQPSAFPTPIVSIQNAPAVPDPSGVAGVLTALGKQAFPDITGLAGTQANAAAAYSQALDTAYKFGKEASTLAQQAAMLGAKDKAMSAIDKAEAAGQIDANDAKQLRVSALKKMVGDTPTDAKAASVGDRLKVIDDQQAKGRITAERATELRNQVLQGLDPENTQQNEEQKATTETIRKIPGASVQSVETTDASGATTKITAQPTTPSIDSAQLTTEVAAAVDQLKTSESPFYLEQTSAEAVTKLRKLFASPDDANATTTAKTFAQNVDALRLNPAAGGAPRTIIPERATLRYALALTGPGPATPTLAGNRVDDMICIASMSKLAILYAAFQLRADVDTILSTSSIGTDQSPAYLNDAEEAVAQGFLAAKDPALQAIGRTRSWWPVLNRIFAIQAFLAYDRKDRPGKLQFRTSVDTDGTAIDELPFLGRLKLTMENSDNDAATTCIADIGLPYIKALLTRSGFADISGAGKGLWLSTTFGYQNSTWPARAGDRAVTAGISSRSCEATGSLKNSGTTGQGGTARAIATFYLLLQRRLLVDAYASEGMLDLLTTPHQLVTGLDANGTVEKSYSKIGILGSWYHDGAHIISRQPPRTAGGTPGDTVRLWIGVVLLSNGGGPIERFAPELERAVDDYLIALGLE